MDNMADRFQRSAKRWSRQVEAVERAEPIPDELIDPRATDLFDIGKERGAVAYAGLRVLADQAVTSMSLQVFDLNDDCDSPIELPMALALVIVARHHGWAVKLISPHGGHEYGDHFEPPSGPGLVRHLRIEPQAQLGEYRVDFLLTLDGSESGTATDGRRRTASQQLVIECDGHDYHERTKEHARRDRERDRRLQEFGFLVFRFTGQEIWEDVFKCARQTLDTLSDRVAADLRKPFPPA